MKLPFIVARSEFDALQPRKHLGQRKDLDPDVKDILETIDVLDQRSLWLADVAVTNRYLLLLVLAACLPQVYALVQLWVKAP
jgi:hypothetical protein